jgi:hypothetical protein
MMQKMSSMSSWPDSAILALFGWLNVNQVFAGEIKNAKLNA